MSGIAGIYNLDGSPINMKLLQRMTTAMEHRGNRGSLRVINSFLGMAHYQLYSTPEAIREKQPLQNQKGTCWITCDGRIDNFDEPDQSAVFYKLMDALAAAAKSENCRVLLWGHGADAFLDGSITYLVSYLRKLKLISLARDLRRWRHYTGFPYLKLIHRYLFRPLVYPRYWMEVSDNRPPWISRKIWRKYTKVPKSKFWQSPSITNPMVRQWYEFGLQTRRCHSWLDNQILLKHQVESRCPFFDRRLVEYLLRVPVYQKIRPGIRKFLSYRAFQDIVPKLILERYDHINPFAFVIESLRHEWPEIRKALSSTLPYLNNYIDEQEFLKELKRVRHGAPEQESTAEAVVLLALWLRGIDSSVTERR